MQNGCPDVLLQAKGVVFKLEAAYTTLHVN